jgi:hypothetical protein
MINFFYKVFNSIIASVILIKEKSHIMFSWQYQKAWFSATFLLTLTKLLFSFWGIKLGIFFNFSILFLYIYISIKYEIFGKIREMLKKFFSSVLSVHYTNFNTYGLTWEDKKYIEEAEGARLHNFLMDCGKILNLLFDFFLQGLITIRIIMLLEPYFFLVFQFFLINFLLFNQFLTFSYVFSCLIGMSRFVFLLSDQNEQQMKNQLMLICPEIAPDESYSCTRKNILILYLWCTRSLLDLYYDGEIYNEKMFLGLLYSEKRLLVAKAKNLEYDIFEMTIKMKKKNSLFPIIIIFGCWYFLWGVIMMH